MVAALIASLASEAALSTSCFCLFFSSVVRFLSASILSLTSLAVLSISLLASAFWSVKSLPGTYAALILSLPSCSALAISSGVVAALIASLASEAALSTSCFCLFFSSVVKFWSASILSLTSLAVLSISLLASAFCSVKSLPGTYAALILSLPSCSALAISSGVVAALIASLASEAALSTSCFCLFFSSVVRFLSASILSLTSLAVLSISLLASAFWSVNSLPGW